MQLQQHLDLLILLTIAAQIAGIIRDSLVARLAYKPGHQTLGKAMLVSLPLSLLIYLALALWSSLQAS